VRERHGPVWARILASNVVSLLVDSIIFSTIAFYGIFPLLPVIVGQYVIKNVISALNIPFAYLSRAIYRTQQKRMESDV